MSTREQFLPKSGPWVRDPNEMGSMYGTNHSIKDTATSLASVAVDTTFTAKFIKQGAYETAVSNDTYVTVCDITGAGICSAIVGLAAGNNNDVSTIEITVDGKVYTISHTLANANYRYVIGLMTHTASITAGYSAGPNDGDDSPIDISNNAKIPVIVWPVMARAFGMPALRFDTGLKVRCKVTTVNAAAQYKRCAVLYTLD